MAFITPSPIVSKQPITPGATVNALLERALPAWTPTPTGAPPAASWVPTLSTTSASIKHDTKVGILVAIAIVGIFVGVLAILTLGFAISKVFRKTKRAPGVEDVEVRAANWRPGDDSDAKITKTQASHQPTRTSNLAAAARVTDSRR
ncbi:hypothetical protein BU16DRAFT_23678 [Lophium mytilinum]|uniref:Uncharacterized protein n=1 Tax=Lophium mytilinum TaxID=390894 RepID=A0A6A6RES3_9PEZI|nr:hypothetical protein BU16DRAFT_23678 [Lophium mytilinum]